MKPWINALRNSMTIEWPPSWLVSNCERLAESNAPELDCQEKQPLLDEDLIGMRAHRRIGTSIRCRLSSSEMSSYSEIIDISQSGVRLRTSIEDFAPHSVLRWCKYAEEVIFVWRDESYCGFRFQEPVADLKFSDDTASPATPGLPIFCKCRSC